MEKANIFQIIYGIMIVILTALVIYLLVKQGAAGPPGPVGPEGPVGPKGTAGDTLNLLTAGSLKDTAVINAPSGLYYTLPVIAVFQFTHTGAPIVTGSTYAQISTNNNTYVPYYTYKSVPIINRGITFTNTSSIHGGYWKFQQPGIYEITSYWTAPDLNQTGTIYATILCSASTLGQSSPTIIASNNWSSVTSTRVPCSSVINTIINVNNTNLFYFISEKTGIGLATSIQGNVTIKWISKN